jgi:hypothetical protein
VMMLQVSAEIKLKRDVKPAAYVALVTAVQEEPRCDLFVSWRNISISLKMPEPRILTAIAWFHQLRNLTA